jgi:hypothetical protein
VKRIFILGFIATLLLSSCDAFIEAETQMASPPADEVSQNAQSQTLAPDERQFSWASRGIRLDNIALNEICFLPADGEYPYIEIKNYSAEAKPLAGYSIQNQDGQQIILPGDLPLLASGALFLILFDGQGGWEGNFYHAEGGDFLNIASDRIVLMGEEGDIIDQAVWGNDQPEGIMLGSGGIQEDLVAGSSIGRAGDSSLSSWFSWAVFHPEITSPGSPNPQPSVEVMLPLNGAFFKSPYVELTWYAVPGADRYQVQIARDEAFTDLVMDAITTAPMKNTNPLVEGTYFWRVQASNANGSTSIFSPVHSFEVIPNEGSTAAENTPKSVKLEVIPVFQQKDSPMLLLEAGQENGAHAWNKAHQGYAPDDPADSANSVLASIIMLNHYYGGNMTQDRLGYEIYKDRFPGPEMDLAYGSGPTMVEIQQMLTYALGEPKKEWHTSNQVAQTSFDDFIQVVLESIDSGNPVIALVPGHSLVISGYETSSGNTRLLVNDPAVGSYTVTASSVNWTHAFSVSEPQIAGLEDSLLIDSDRDGILDFDESERFHTDPYTSDSDEDGIPDGAEVRASVFDDQFGYGRQHQLNTRDIDQDGLAMELDIDSDNGGCLDGFEDRDKNGVINSPIEGSNLNPLDDRCYALEMTKSFQDDWGTTLVTWIGSFDLDPQQHIFGQGVTMLSHAGPCTDSELRATFSIKGKAEESLMVEFIHLKTFEVSTFSPREIKNGCSLGQAIDENWAVSYGVYGGMPPVVEIPMPIEGSETILEFNTPSDAPRQARIYLVVRPVGGGN